MAKRFSGAIQADVGLRRSIAAIHDGLGDQFFSGAAFAKNHRSARAGHGFHGLILGFVPEGTKWNG